jgi:hypothetical protein
MNPICVGPYVGEREGVNRITEILSDQNAGDCSTVSSTRLNGPPFRPPISTTPRDETDTKLHDSLKTKDMRDETDTPQPIVSFF